MGGENEAAIVKQEENAAVVAASARIKREDQQSTEP